LFVAFDRFPILRSRRSTDEEPGRAPGILSTVTDLEAKLSAILAADNRYSRRSATSPPGRFAGPTANKLLDVDTTLMPAQDDRRERQPLVSNVDAELKTTIEELRRAIASADQVLKSTDATLVGANAPAQQEIRDALQEIVRAARSVRVLADYLERHPESLIRGKTGEPK
jgi:paraquat-inducible protein B